MAPTQEKISIRGVEFRQDGQLIASSKPVLDAAAALIKTQPDAEVYVNAYCDPTGGSRLNEQISKARAQAVKAYLEKDGVAPERLFARGFGATEFVANNTSANGRRQNRRIELIVVRNEHLAAGKPARDRSGVDESFNTGNRHMADVPMRANEIFPIIESARSQPRLTCSSMLF
jgi:hypothetical protein